MNRSDCFETLYEGLFSPLSTYREIADAPAADNRLLTLAGVWVVLVSGMAPLVSFAQQGGELGALAWQVPLNAVMGVVLWLAMAGIVALLAYTFNGNGRPKTFLILSSFATLPWLFMGPLALFKNSLGPLGLILSGGGSLLVWLWSVILFAMALAVTYRLTLDRVIIILAMPFVMSLVGLFWVAGFFSNLQHLRP